MKNLWKNLELVKSEIQNPVDLVKEQAEYLEEGTEGLLKLSIDSVEQIGLYSRSEMIKLNFTPSFKYMVALNTSFYPDYNYNIFGMYYGITFYPLLLSIPSDIADEIIKEREFSIIRSSGNKVFFKLENQDEFEQIMEAIFNSDILRKVMGNLKMIMKNDMEDEFPM